MISKERTSDLLGPALCMATAPTVMVVSAMLPCLAFIAFAISMTVCMETRILGFLGQMAPTLDSNSEVSIKSEVFASLVTLEENRTNIPTDISTKSLLKSAQQRRLLTLLPLLGQAWDRSQDRHTVDFASNSRQTFLPAPYESFRALQEVALTSWKYSPQGHQLRVLRYPLRRIQRWNQQQHHRFSPNLVTGTVLMITIADRLIAGVPLGTNRIVKSFALEMQRARVMSMVRTMEVFCASLSTSLCPLHAQIIECTEAAHKGVPQ